MTGALLAAQDSGTLLFELQKNSRERIRIGIAEYRGQRYVDVRIWFVGKDGVFEPSKKGIAIRPNQVAELIQGLNLAARAVDPQGGA